MDTLQLTKTLCNIPSMTGEETQVVHFLEQHLRDLGLNVLRIPVSPERDNLFATFGEASPKILLTTHVDTVPPHLPFSEDDEFLYGRGVCDAKGIAAAMIEALKRLLQCGETRVGLLFVVGEETSSDGAKVAVQHIPQVDYLIDGEPTDLKLVSAMKGALCFTLHAQGKAGHSAYPESGASAVHALIAATSPLLERRWGPPSPYGETTLNIGKIQGGMAPNVIAPTAEAHCIMRLAHDVEEVENTLRSQLPPAITMQTSSRSSPLKLHTVDDFETCIVAFGSDVPHLSPKGVPLLLGPGSILDAHTAHEKVRKADLLRAVDLYVKLCNRLLESTTTSPVHPLQKH